MGCVPHRFRINDMTKGQIGDKGYGVFFLMDGRDGGQRGFDLIGVLSEFINLKKLDSILILILLDFDFDSWSLCLYLAVLLLVLK
jgi:hypothetical protein